MQIVIAGMHRSGTSVIARLFAECGCFLGRPDDLMPAKPDNPTGFWEHLEAFDINVEILEAAGVAWDTAVGGEIEDHSDADRAALCTRILEFVNGMSSHENWAVKDPRFALTFPIWRPLLSDPVVIWCLRDPMEIATSLRGRNGFPIQLGVALWEAYTVAGLLAMSDVPVVPVSYSDLLKDPVSEVGRIVEEVNSVGMGTLEVPAGTAVESIVNPRLHRSTSSPEQEAEHLTSHRRRVWHLSRTADCWSGKMECPALSELSRDEILRHRRASESGPETESPSGLSMEEIVERLDQRDAERIGAMSAKLEALDSRVGQLYELMADRDESTRTEIADLRKRLALSDDERSDLSAEISNRNHELKVVRAELERHQAVLADYRSSAGGRLLDWWWRVRTRK